MNKALLASLFAFGLAFASAAPVLAQGRPPNFPARSDSSSYVDRGGNAQAQEQRGESEAAAE
jgi:hypothetical protein